MAEELSVTNVIAKARASFDLLPYSVTYDGSPHTATGTATGVLGEDLSGLLDLSGTTHTNADVYNDTVAFIGNTNYEAETFPLIDTIAKAHATFDITPYDVTYDGREHTASGTATGVLGEDLSALLDFSGTTHTRAGSYSDTVTFAGEANYKAEDIPVTNTIAQAGQTIDFGPLPDRAYGEVFVAAASASSGLPVDFSIISGPATAALDAGSGRWTITVTGVGTVVVQADQPGDNNYRAAAPVQQTFTTHKADQAIEFPPIPDKSYGDSFTLDAPASSGLPVSFSIVSGPAEFGGAGTGKWVITLTGLGTVTVQAEQGGDDNYNAAEPVQQSFDVGKAHAVFDLKPYSVTYDGQPHTADGIATGAFGEDLTPLLDFSGTTHTDANTYDDTVAFAGNDYYEAELLPISDTIAKARATIEVTGYEGTYDGRWHGADVGRVIGVRGEDLSVHFDAGEKFRDVRGGTAHWLFVGVANYADEEGDVDIVIRKARASIAVDGYSGAYDGRPHGATGSATGVAGEDLSTGLDLGEEFIDPPGGTARWAFSGGTNYEDDEGEVDIVINKARQTIDFAPLPDRAFGDAPFSLNAIASSGLPVSFRVVSGPAVIVSGNMVQLLGWGAVTVEASQPGGANHLPATPVARTFNVAAPAGGRNSITAAGDLDPLASAAGRLAGGLAGPIGFAAGVTFDRKLKNAKGPVFVWFYRTEDGATATYLARADAITAVRRASSKKTASVIATASLFRVGGGGDPEPVASGVALRLDFVDGRLAAPGAADLAGVTLGTAVDLWLSSSWHPKKKSTAPQYLWSALPLEVSADRTSAVLTASDPAYFVYKTRKAKSVIDLATTSADEFKAYLNKITGKAVDSVVKDGDKWTILLKPKKKLDWSRLQGYSGDAFGVAIG